MANQPSKMNKDIASSPYYQNYMANRGGIKSSTAPKAGISMASPGMGGFGYAPMGMTKTSKPVVAPTLEPMPQYTEKQIKKIEKQRKRQSSHFFVMRKGVCFLMFVCSLLVIAILALSFLGIMPSFSSIFAIPDNTPVDERVEEEFDDADLNNLGVNNAEADEDVDADADADADADEDSLFVDGVYIDQTTYIGVADFIYGFANGILGMEMVDEEGNSLSANYDETLLALQEIVVEYPEDTMASIASMAYQYMPIAIILLAIIAVITLILSGIAMMGRRIFKGFGLLGILMTLCSVVVVIGGLATLGWLSGNPTFTDEGVLVSVLDMSQISSFLMRIISGAPATALDPLVDVMPVVYCGGLGLLVILVAPLLVAVLSIFARYKLPYSIFDK